MIKHMILETDKASVALENNMLIYSRTGMKDKHSCLYNKGSEEKNLIVANLIKELLHELKKTLKRFNYMSFYQVMKIQASGYDDFLVSPEFLMAENICTALEEIGLLGYKRSQWATFSKVYLASDFARFIKTDSVKDFHEARYKKVSQ